MRELTEIINSADIEAAAGEAVPEPAGDCPLCGGSGYVLRADGTAARCSCYARRRLLAAQKEARLQPRLRQMSFKNFDLGCYPAGEPAPGGKGETYYALAKQAFDKAAGLCAAVCRGEQPRGLLLLGQVGSGKTHLAAAAANRLLSRGHRVLFLVVPDFLDELRSSFSGYNEAETGRLLEQARHTEILVLDDLGSHNLTDWTKSVLFAILNFRVNEGLTTIATSNLDIAALQELLGTRSLSRLISLCEPCLLASARDLRLRGLEKV